MVLVDFWATYCKPCRAEMPELIKMANRLRAKGLVLLTVSADEPEQEAEAVKFAGQVGVTRARLYPQSGRRREVCQLCRPEMERRAAGP